MPIWKKSQIVGYSLRTYQDKINDLEYELKEARKEIERLKKQLKEQK